jgi:alanine dehydrogenase
MKDGRLTLGLIGSSTKENELRAAIHPAHFSRIEPEIRPHVYAERGFGGPFRIPDEEYEPHVAGLMEREELFERCDAVMIFKPTEKDFPFFRDGLVLWGAVHTVQNENIVQVAIDRKMTCIAMESMFHWRPDGTRSTWIFNTQSELAGYCSVLHSLRLLGIKGWHDQPRRAAIISFGSVGRGAVHALGAMDFNDITVYTQRPPVSVLWTPPTVVLRQYVRAGDDPSDTLVVQPDGGLVPFGEELAGFDIIVNAVAQDTDRPLMFVRNAHLDGFRRGTLVVDVSCDRGMGFEWARPTTFDEPLLEVGGGIVYYAVDHSPSYLHDTASLEHSKEAVPYVKHVVGGREAWDANPTVGHAIEILDGGIVNEKILTFQNRERDYPHRKRG